MDKPLRPARKSNPLKDQAFRLLLELLDAYRLDPKGLPKTSVSH